MRIIIDSGRSSRLRSAFKRLPWEDDDYVYYAYHLPEPQFVNAYFVVVHLPIPPTELWKENIPTATAEKVKAGMLEGVEAALGLSKGSLKKPLYTRVQLWGAALPTNTPGIPCIFDPQGRAGICGDWLLGSSLESAALSGMSLANHIADYFQSGGAHPEEFAVGLQNEFQPLEGHDVGQFPGLESEKKQMNEPELINLPPEVVSA